jgi:non-ribosomal peptide synthetase component E (peptide arylation enzyme)
MTVGFLGSKNIDLAAETDGRVVDYDVRIVDGNGRDVPSGSEGEICARGPALFVGYADLDQNRDAFDREGYFHTGDVGYLTKDHAVVVTGRIKDLINRGGEKLSAKEIEDILYTHPGVQEAAVVSMPHARLGETVCYEQTSARELRTATGSRCSNVKVAIPDAISCVERHYDNWPEQLCQTRLEECAL